MKNSYFLKLLLAITLFLNIGSQAQSLDSVKVYIDSAIYFMETKAMNGKGLDWGKVRSSAYLKANGAKNTKEAFPALTYAFEQLKDHHGMVANQDTFYRYAAPINFEEVLSPGIKKEFLKGNRIVTAFFDKSIAYLRVPGMHVNRQEDIDAKANMLRDSLCMLLKQES